MKKALLLQVPYKFYEVMPIFYAEAKKHNFFDKFYIWTDYPEPYGLGEDCLVQVALKDRMFASNMKNLLKVVDEDVFFVCCEDHIMTDQNNVATLNNAFDWFINQQDAGFLRLTHQEKAPTEGDSSPYLTLSRKYQYYISLQPAIWKRQYFETCLKDGEGSWEFEPRGSSRVKKQSNLKSYMVKERLFWFTNFYREGKYYRRQFVDYAIKHGVKLQHDWPVYTKKRTVTLDEYIQEATQNNANLSDEN